MNQEILREVIEQDYTKIQQDIETFLKNAVSQNKANGVVFGLSGGIDSVSVAYLSSKIFGKKAFSSSDRMTLQEIHGIVDGQTHLTCEYLTLVCVAALIASVGLRRNSATTVISSMLVSPLMGPILGITFGFAVNDKKMIRTSIRNELVGILICLAVGVAVGAALGWRKPKNQNNNKEI